MTFLQLVNEVINITKRPDLRVDIQREVNSAFRFIAGEGNFVRDVDEMLVDYSVLGLDPTQTVQSIPLSTFPRFRKFSYIRPIDRNCYLRHTQADQIFNMGKEDCDVYYVVGNTVKLKTSTPSSGLIVGYFTYPTILVADTDTNWMAEISPYVVIHRAAASIFSQVGNTTETNKHEQLFALYFTSANRDYKYGADYG